VLGIERTFLPALCDRTIEMMGDAYPELHEQAETIGKWASAEEDGFRRTLAQGERLLADLVRRAKEDGTSWIAADDAFRLHDTYGFPYELTKELLAEQGLAVDDQGFEELMERAREVARGGATAVATGEGDHERVITFARSVGFETRFVGYEATEWETVIGALEPLDERLLAKLEESPFYAEGGGQVSDTGFVETSSGRALVDGVYRLGDDQAVALRPVEGELVPGESARAAVDRQRRLATMANHTATHLLHAALRERLGTHVRQAGSYVGPDKLRFDFTHGEKLSRADAAAIEERVNEWIVGNHPVRAVETTRHEAEAMGAMALFGEKYGDWVRMVEVEDVSRELCGGTHVLGTAEVGLFQLTAESSSAANVRRIEALTGPAGIDSFRARTAELRELAGILRVPEHEVVAAVSRLTERVKELERRPREGGRELVGSLVERAADVGGARVVAEVVDVPDARMLRELSNEVRQALGDGGVVVLGSAAEERVHLVANVSPSMVERGVKAGDVVAIAADLVGGGGGGRDTMAQAGGRAPEKLPEAIAAARLAIERTLS
jgi:alanyl-tRNA synthetase